jgi:hypothetical protein
MCRGEQGGVAGPPGNQGVPEYDLPDEASEIDMAKAGAKLAALARPKCAALADALGEDPAKWKEYWERTLAEKQPVPAKEP